jgi:phosphoglycerate dehydrogenase-like enzyme
MTGNTTPDGSRSVDIAVFRKGTEGLSTEEYTEAIRERLPDFEVRRARTPGEEQDLIRHAKIATGVGIDEELLSHAQELEMFVVASSGCGHLPLDSLEERGVTLVNAAGIHAPGIAEQVIGNCLVFARNIHEGWRRKQSSQWRHYQANEFTDSTVTVVGLGAIGEAIVQRLEGFDVDTIGVRYTPEKGGPTDEVIGFDYEDFHRALARTDYLVLATPLSETTRELMGKEEFATLPPNAVVVNASRGGVVDTDALLESLQKEGIRGAALDVTNPEPLPNDHPLWEMENVFITPHMGGHTPKHWDRLADILAENVDKLEGDVRTSLTNRVSIEND